MERFRIDWASLGELLVRKPCTARDRKRLAENRHKKTCAKHKGRNHLANAKRRLEAIEKQRKRKADAARRLASSKDYHAAVRAYWLGLRDDHP